MTMYTDSTLQPIYQGQSYNSPNGTQYPAGFPLETIEGVHLVEETMQPVDEKMVVTGFIIDENFKQVWQMREKTIEESQNDLANAVAALNQKRISLLQNTDWTMLPDIPLTSELVAAYKKYRADLRALPINSNNGNLDNIIFPTPPA